MSAILHIQILLHAVQPEPEPFLAAQPNQQNLSSPRNQNLSLPRNQNQQNLSSPRNQTLLLAAQLEHKTKDLLVPRNQTQKPEAYSLHSAIQNPRPSLRRAIQNVPDSSRSGLVVTAAACRYSEEGTGIGTSWESVYGVDGRDGRSDRESVYRGEGAARSMATRIDTTPPSAHPQAQSA